MEPQPRPEAQLSATKGAFSKALAQIAPGNICQFLPNDGIRVLGPGVYDPQAQSSNEAEITFTHWQDLANLAVGTADADRAAIDPSWREHIDRPEDQAVVTEWRENLPSASDFQIAAQEILNEREAQGDEEYLTCDTCEGHGQRLSNCVCTAGEMYESEETSLRQRIESPNPDCGFCEGEGGKVYDCNCCSGVGKIAKYPVISLLSSDIEGGLREATIVLDIARLVADGEAPIELRQKEAQFAHQSTAEQLYYPTIRQLVKSKLPEIGITTDTCMVEIFVRNSRGANETYSLQLEEKFTDGHPLERYWVSIRDGVIADSGRNSRTELPPTPRELLEMHQLSIAKSFANVHNERQKNSAGIIIKEELLAWELPDVYDGFMLLRQAVEAQGFTVGFGYSHGVDGYEPAVTILDQAGHTLVPLGSGSSLRVVLAEALLKFEQAFPD